MMDFYEDGSFEAMYVQAKPAVTTATVARGWFGTTAATHSNGAAVLYNPRYISFKYREAINNALAAISVAFGKQGWQTSVSFTSTARLLSVPATAIRVFSVAEKPSGYTSLTPVSFRFQPNVPTGVVTSGKAVEVTSYNPGTGTAYIGYEVMWPQLTTLAGTLDADYPADAEDLIILGAIAYLTDESAFMRAAFDHPHVFGRESAAEAGAVERTAGLDLQRFLMRRSEAGARPLLRQHAWSWVK